MAQHDVGHDPVLRFQGDEHPEAAVRLPVEVEVRCAAADDDRLPQEVGDLVDRGGGPDLDEVAAQGNALAVRLVLAQSHLDHGRRHPHVGLECDEPTTVRQSPVHVRLAAVAEAPETPPEAHGHADRAAEHRSRQCGGGDSTPGFGPTEDDAVAGLPEDRADCGDAHHHGKGVEAGNEGFNSHVIVVPGAPVDVGQLGFQISLAPDLAMIRTAECHNRETAGRDRLAQAELRVGPQQAQGSGQYLVLAAVPLGSGHRDAELVAYLLEPTLVVQAAEDVIVGQEPPAAARKFLFREFCDFHQASPLDQRVENPTVPSQDGHQPGVEADRLQQVAPVLSVQPLRRVHLVPEPVGLL